MAEKAELELIIRDPDSGKAPPAPPKPSDVAPKPTPKPAVPDLPSEQFLKQVADIKGKQAASLTSEYNARNRSPLVFDESSPAVAELEQLLRLAKIGTLSGQQALADPTIPADAQQMLEKQLEQLKREEHDLVTELAARKAYERELEQADAKRKLDAIKEPDRIAALPLERRNYAEQFGTKAEAERFAKGEEAKKVPEVPPDALDAVQEAIKASAEAKRRHAAEIQADAEARTTMPGLFSEGSPEAEAVTNKLKMVQAAILENQAKFADPGIDEALKKVLEAKDATLREAKKKLSDELSDVRALEAEEKAKATNKRRQEAKYGPGAVERQQAGKDLQNAGQAMSLAGMQKAGGIASGAGQVMGALAGAGGPMAAITGAIMVVQKIKDTVVEGVDKLGAHAAAIGGMSGRGAENALREGATAVLDPTGMNPFIQGVSAATKQLDKFTDALIDGAAKQHAAYSPEISVAFAQADVREVQRGMQRSPLIEHDLSELITAQSLRTEAGKDLEAELIRLITPFATSWNSSMGDIMEGIASIVRAINESKAAAQTIGTATKVGLAALFPPLIPILLIYEIVQWFQKEKKKESTDTEGPVFDPFRLIGPDPNAAVAQMLEMWAQREANQRAF